ncbi:hypothetical protein [Coleofasciculus sp. E2-BRE-01]|uniref:hypothetical protein n=1 Tax=Coleofasciculus sp. E2-BRE-01 TaxID=3069524 RepID=UPI0032F6D9CE
MNQLPEPDQAAKLNLQMALGKIPPPQHHQQLPTPSGADAPKEPDIVQKFLWWEAIGDLLSSFWS